MQTENLKHFLSKNSLKNKGKKNIGLSSSTSKRKNKHSSSEIYSDIITAVSRNNTKRLLKQPIKDSSMSKRKKKIVDYSANNLYVQPGTSKMKQNFNTRKSLRSSLMSSHQLQPSQSIFEDQKITQNTIKKKLSERVNLNNHSQKLNLSKKPKNNSQLSRKYSSGSLLPNRNQPKEKNDVNSLPFLFFSHL